MRNRTWWIAAAVVVLLVVIAAANGDRLYEALLRMHGVRGHGSH